MRVQILLCTALYRGRFGADHTTELKGPVMEVRGTATVRDGGLEVLVASLHDERGRDLPSPFGTIFLPGSKIDFYVIESPAET